MSKLRQDGEQRTPIEFADTWQKDAFGAVRMSTPTNYISTVPLYHEFEHYYSSKVTGTGTFSIISGEPAILFDCPAIGDEVIRQTKTWWSYQAGNSQLAEATGVLDTNVGTISEIGYYGDFTSDGNGFNGVALGNDVNGETYICLYTSVPGLSHQKVYLNKNEWNGQDRDYIKYKLAGSGINFAKAQIFALDLEFLAVGRVRAGFYYAGKFWEAHTFDNANKNTSPYMLTASLPIRYYCKNVSRVGGASMKQICSTVKSEGGRDIFGVRQVIRSWNPGNPTYPTPYNAPTPIAITNGAYKDVLVFSPKSLFNTRPNRASVIPIAYSITVIGQGTACIEFLHGERSEIGSALVVGAAWRDVSSSVHEPSCTEYLIASDFADGHANIYDAHVHGADFSSGDVKGSVSAGGTDFKSFVYLNRGLDHIDDANAGMYAFRVHALNANIEIYIEASVLELY